MKNRLKLICSELGYSQQELADKLSISVRNLRSYLYAAKSIPMEFFTLLNDRLNVNINWILTGRGRMFIEEYPAETETETKTETETAKQCCEENQADINIYAASLQKLRRRLNLSFEQLSKKIAVPADIIEEYENGSKIPSIELPIQLYKKYGINLNWFLTGEGEMFNKKEIRPNPLEIYLRSEMMNILENEGIISRR